MRGPGRTALLLGLLLASPAGLAGTLESAAEAYRDGDYASAAEQFRALAEQGVARAQAVLGLMYLYGEGVAADPAQSFAWYRRAAETGYAPAQYRLAEMYAAGEGVAADPDRARDWLERAAGNGEARAREALRSGDRWVPERTANGAAAPPPATSPRKRPSAFRLLADVRHHLRDAWTPGDEPVARPARVTLRLSLGTRRATRPGAAVPRAPRPAPDPVAPGPALKLSVMLARRPTPWPATVRPE